MGAGRSRKRLSMEKMVALAPMPRPISITAGGVGADAKADGEDGCGGCAAMLAQCAQGVSAVAQKRFKPGQAAAFTNCLARLLHSAEADEGLAAAFNGREAGTDAVFRMHLDVACKLGVEVLVVAHSAEQAAEANPKCSEPGHQASSAGFRKRARISVVCSHSAAAFFNWRWPSLVSS